VTDRISSQWRYAPLVGGGHTAWLAELLQSIPGDGIDTLGVRVTVEVFDYEDDDEIPEGNGVSPCPYP